MVLKKRKDPDLSQILMALDTRSPGVTDPSRSGSEPLKNTINKNP
jgi:hypothetical protein